MIRHLIALTIKDLKVLLKDPGGIAVLFLMQAMLHFVISHALADSELAAIRPEDYAAEWTWDGIRAQAVPEAGVARLYTRTGDDISRTFHALVAALDF